MKAAMAKNEGTAMKVSDVAQEFNTTTEFILQKLKTMKLKAKGADQELNKWVVAILRKELKKNLDEIPKRGKVKSESEKAKKGTPKRVSLTEILKKEEEKKKQREKTASAPSPSPAPESAAVLDAPAAVQPSVESNKDERGVVSETAAGQTPTKQSTTKEPAPFVPVKPLSKRKRRTPVSDARASSPSIGVKQESRTEKEREDAAATTVEKKPIEVPFPVTVKELAQVCGVKVSSVVKHLMGMKILANINDYLDEQTVRKVASVMGFEVIHLKTPEEKLEDWHARLEEDPDKLKPRPPVVTFMGHVDHGKTSLLDKIRQTKVAEQEHGGITQHIGAYSVTVPRGTITFLDTPGHEAFTAMRARGAHVTDLVVLVVAADEGVMPQTDEAIDHARAAGVPIVVALNKMDRPGANPDKVKQELAQRDLTPEDWGGKTVVVPVSAMTGEGIDELLEMILLEAELLELKANPDKPAAGIVLEAHLSSGRGTAATLLVQSGTLRLNDHIVVGPHHGKVRAMFDEHGQPLKEAGPSTPVEVLGLSDVPLAGERFYAVDDEDTARRLAEKRALQLRQERQRPVAKVNLEDLYQRIQEGEIKEFNVIVKADVQGSLEALKDALMKIPSHEVKLNIIHSAVGDVNPSDVILAAASNAVILTFQVNATARARQELEQHGVELRSYRVIYDVVDDVKKALEGLLTPQRHRKILGRVEIRQVFKLSKAGVIAGCYVTKGKIMRRAMVDVWRGDSVIHTGRVASLKRFKDDVREVQEGYECGVSLEGFTDYQPGDILEVFEEELVARTVS